MRYALILMFFLVGRLCSFGQLDDRTSIGEIPISNIAGWESKKGPLAFNYTECEQSYISLNLTAFDLGTGQDKDLWAKYNPFLYIKVKYGDMELIKVIKADKVKKVDPETNSRARSVYNLPLFGPFPYSGESVQVIVQLYAYKVEDKLESAINILDNFSGLFPTQLNQIVKVSNVVSSSLNQIIPNCKRVVSIDYTWNPKIDGTAFDNPSILKEGYFIFHPSTQNLDYSKLKIDKQSQVKSTEGGNEDYLYKKNIDFVVLSFTNFVTRPDFQKLDYYSKYQECLVSAVKGESVKMDEQYKELVGILYANSGLTNWDKLYQHTYLYGNILKQIKNVKTDYKELPTPILDCIQAGTIKEKLAYLEIRKQLIERSQIQPGEFTSLRQTQEKIKILDAATQTAIFDKLKDNTPVVIDLAMVLNKDRRLSDFFDKTFKIQQ